MLPKWVTNALGQQACSTAKDQSAATEGLMAGSDAGATGTFDSASPSTMIARCWIASWLLSASGRSTARIRVGSTVSRLSERTPSASSSRSGRGSQDRSEGRSRRREPSSSRETRARPVVGSARLTASAADTSGRLRTWLRKLDSRERGRASISAEVARKGDVPVLRGRPHLVRMENGRTHG